MLCLIVNAHRTSHIEIIIICRLCTHCFVKRIIWQHQYILSLTLSLFRSCYVSFVVIIFCVRAECKPNCLIKRQQNTRFISAITLVITIYTRIFIAWVHLWPACVSTWALYIFEYFKWKISFDLLLWNLYMRSQKKKHLQKKALICNHLMSNDHFHGHRHTNIMDSLTKK